MTYFGFFLALHISIQLKIFPVNKFNFYIFIDKWFIRMQIFIYLRHIMAPLIRSLQQFPNSLVSVATYPILVMQPVYVYVLNNMLYKDETQLHISFSVLLNQPNTTKILLFSSLHSLGSLLY